VAAVNRSGETTSSPQKKVMAVLALWFYGFVAASGIGLRVIPTMIRGTATHSVSAKSYFWFYFEILRNNTSSKVLGRSIPK
jgi:hypothetical protein